MRKFRIMLIGFAMLLVTGCISIAVEQQVPGIIVVFEGFDGAPEFTNGWSGYGKSSVVGETLFFDEDPDNPGHMMVRIVDESSSVQLGLRKVLVAEPGVTYKATVEVKAVQPENGSVLPASMWLDFVGDDGERIPGAFRNTSSKNTEWTQLEITMTAPEGTVGMRFDIRTATQEVGIIYARNPRIVIVP